MEDGRAEGSSTIGDGGQAAVSLTADGMHICTFESSQLEGMCVGDLLYFVYSSFVFEVLFFLRYDITMIFHGDQRVVSLLVHLK